MYIGPWQEYKLSKEKTHHQNSVPTHVQKEIEDVLLQTLGPNAAHTALKAVDQYFQQQQQTRNETPRSAFSDNTATDFLSVPWKEGNQSRRPVRPNIPRGPKVNSNMQHQRTLQNRTKIQLPPLDTAALILDPNEISSENNSLNSSQKNDSLKVSSIIRSVNSARTDGKGQVKSTSHPLSVRSSKSEPTHQSNRLPKLSIHDRSLPTSSAQPTPSTTATTTSSSSNSYNSHAIVNFLRMERNQKAKYEIIKLTGWERSMKRDQPDLSASGPSHRTKLQPISSQEKKLEQIQQMKELYLQHSQQQQEIKQEISALAKHLQSNRVQLNPIQPSPQRNISKKEEYLSHETPIITDQEITQADLLKVSKYFDSTSFQQLLSTSASYDPPPDLQPQERGLSTLPEMSPSVRKKGQSHILNQALPLPSPTRKSVLTTVITDEEEDEVEENNTSSHHLPRSHSPLKTPGKGLHEDSFYTGGVDGLLSWTKQLNLDDF